MFIIKVTDTNWDDHNFDILDNGLFSSKEGAEEYLLNYFTDECGWKLLSDEEYIALEDDVVNYLIKSDEIYLYSYRNGGTINYEITELQLIK